MCDILPKFCENFTNAKKSTSRLDCTILPQPAFLGESDRKFGTLTYAIIIIIIKNPLTARVVGAPQMILQPVFSLFPCSPLPPWTCRTPGLSIPWCCLPTSPSVCLVFFPLSLSLARWFWPDFRSGLVWSTQNWPTKQPQQKTTPIGYSVIAFGLLHFSSFLLQEIKYTWIDRTPKPATARAPSRKDNSSLTHPLTLLASKSSAMAKFLWTPLLLTSARLSSEHSLRWFLHERKKERKTERKKHFSLSGRKKKKSHVNYFNICVRVCLFLRVDIVGMTARKRN